MESHVRIAPIDPVEMPCFSQSECRQRLFRYTLSEGEALRVACVSVYLAELN